MLAWPFTVATTSALCPRLHPAIGSSPDAKIRTTGTETLRKERAIKVRSVSVDKLGTSSVFRIQISCILLLITGFGRRWGLRLCLNWCLCWRWRRRLPGGNQRAIDHTIHVFHRLCSFHLFAIDEQRWSRVHAEAFAQLDRLLDRGVILLCDACIERISVQILLLSFIACQSVERLVGLRETLVRAAQISSMRMDVVDQIPVARRALRADAVGVNCGAHGPRMLIERKVAIDDVNLISVALRQCRKQLLMHLGAEGAFQVVEPNDQHGSVCWTASRGTPVATHQ